MRKKFLGNYLLLATRNRDKFKEIKEILGENKWKLLSLEDFPETAEVIENGKTFSDNALKKARAAFKATGIPSLADDSGLEVDCLSGAPGVLSSRFAGEKATYRDNNEKLLSLMKDVPMERRRARFKCVVALVDDKEEKWVEGVCEGIILSEYRGENGFGYDPLFFVPEKNKTFAEMTRREKNEISHRGKAFRKMADLLREDE